MPDVSISLNSLDNIGRQGVNNFALLIQYVHAHNVRSEYKIVYLPNCCVSLVISYTSKATASNGN